VSNTTLEAIRTALEKEIQKLTPPVVAKPLGVRNFRQRAENSPWEKARATDIDRRFTLSLLPAGRVQSFGGLSEHEAHADMLVRIGHVKGDNLPDAQGRAAQDCAYLRIKLEDPTIYPTSVWNVEFQTLSVWRETDEAWISDLRFRVVYSEANV